ncbi:hypothetical protein H4Q82_01780 [Pectobacterium carotovorum subsp. carotovorum]|uniref:hypothetical protein n=1 Tax=Pectobacterium carotovorum TaxID=554 RepID=UPI001600F4B5|nr:hypothetical protein [Pectobacterium carotovorum]MBB1525229.1 hypothetical protein [Pectobacterium carotovorum subsp. carotovorum]MCA6964420.1 hypothetical protein [Pectobacterium carotovorum]MCH4986854.1 hypothetical protein [Pectobacterium carotovorum]
MRRNLAFVAQNQGLLCQKTDEVEIGLFFRTQNEAIFGNGAAYDYPDRRALNQERRIS